jgi:hypothetical protein
VLEAPQGCVVQEISINAETANSVQDSGYNYQSGLMNFTITCAEPGLSAEIVMYFYGVSPTDLVLRKFNSNTNGYSTVTGAVLTEVTIGDATATKVVYSVVDGGILDMDGVANGTIVDPVGLGYRVVGVPNTGLGGGI